MFRIILFISLFTKALTNNIYMPSHNISHPIDNFLQQKNILNCFESIEENYLAFKCLKEPRVITLTVRYEDGYWI